jgi:hypothetical protein
VGAGVGKGVDAGLLGVGEGVRARCGSVWVGLLDVFTEQLDFLHRLPLATAVTFPV